MAYMYSRAIIIAVLLLIFGSVFAGSQEGPKELLDFSGKEELEKWYNDVRPRAEQGDPQAQYWMAFIAFTGFRQVPHPSLEDRQRVALEWMRNSALQEYGMALQYLSDSYKHGWMGLRRNLELENCWKLAVDGNVKPTRCVDLERRILDNKPRN